MAGRRILIDGSMARSGGGATYVRNLLPRLAALCPEDRFLVWLRQAELAAALPRSPNLEIEMLPDVGWAGRLRFLVQHAAQRARRWGADIYFSTAEYTPPRPPCPAIASFRNPNVFSRLELGWSARQRARLFLLRRLAGHSARVCRQILFVSADSAAWIGDEVGLPPGRRSVVPHGIDLDAWSRARAEPERLSTGRPFVLSVSSVYRYKNYVRLIEAWAQMARKRTDAPDLVIIGDEPDRKHRRDMEAARRATGPLADRVHIEGEVPYGEIRGWYAGASLFVFPSFLETFGHPLLEAMAMELPTVVADIGVFREIAADCARRADPYDTAALAAEMESLLSDPVSARDLAARGRQRAGAYSWDRSARLHVDLLERVAGP